MVIPTPDSGILDRIYADLVGSRGFVSLNVPDRNVTDSGDLDISITIPSLIVATYGGGTGLPTQRECLGMLDCDGPGNVNKFAEIAASVVLAGELSLASAISASDWVTSHEALGRNR